MLEDQSDQDLIDRIRTLSRPLLPEATEVVPRLPRLEGIRAVLFDVYGTLVISGSGDIGSGQLEDDESAFHQALEAVGLSTEGLGEIQGKELMVQAVRGAHARRRKQGVEYPEVDIVAIWAEVLDRLPSGIVPADGLPARTLRRLALEYECRSNPVWPMPGMGEVLADLLGRGLKLGIVSNAQFYTPLMFEAFLHVSTRDLGFEPALCAFSYQALEAKPSTRLYRQVQEALAQRGIAPEQALYVGNDVLKDIWPASQCGFRTALFAGDRRSLRLREDDPRCADVEPDVVLTDLGQLADLWTDTPADEARGKDGGASVGP